MGFEKIKESAGDLHEQAKEFIDVNVEYYKLWSFKILMKSTTMMLKMFLLGIMLLIVTIFFSIALALAIGYALDNFAWGFFIVGAIYLIVSIVIYKVQDKIVEGPILEKFSKIFLKKY
ncbi:competence protein [Flavobacterium kingsejongi]|jgi:ABC-type multidrug transport system fused ATPase/permease subunit|uniref:Competence protein n=1 Tax=Flavobacterium kingsejongi TaxID=1678728 RepID=A0A2S1LLB6_9FLAO|nr:competence protein [Flavobacterium kingsejongi]AWG24542.1 competence protein [Flavobacterium kingsejongi]